jgi:hypothetical protein
MPKRRRSLSNKKKNTKKPRHTVSTRMPLPLFHSVNEEHVMKMENGKVVMDNWIRKSVNNDKVHLQGRVNKKKINMTRKIQRPKQILLVL